MKYGYARCSPAEERGQDLIRRTRELKAAGAEQIITEREHEDAIVKRIEQTDGLQRTKKVVG